MVDAEQHRAHGRYPLWAPDLDALEEKPDPEPRNHPDDDIEGVHYFVRPSTQSAAAIPSAHGGGECPSAGSSSRCSVPTRPFQRHTPTASNIAQTSRTVRTRPRSVRCTLVMMVLI